MSWFYLALLAPLLYAIINITDDNLLRNIYRSPHLGAIISGLFGGAPLLSLFFKDFGTISMNSAAMALSAGLFTVAFLYCYFLALDKESPSVVAAVTGAVPVALGFVAFVLLKEEFSATKIAGLIIVLFSSTALVINRKEKTHFSQSAAPLLAGSVFICVISVLLKRVYETSDFYSGYMLFSLGMFLGGAYFLLVLFHSEHRAMLHDLRVILRRYLLLFVLVEALGILADFIMNLAISQGPITTIRTIESTQPAFVLLISLAFYPFKPALFREASEGGVAKKLMCIPLLIFGLYLLQYAID